MSNTELLSRLRDLHVELSSINLDLEPGEHVDDETINALGQLVSDIGELVDKAKTEVSQEDLKDEHKGLFDRVVEFDQQHPRVSRFLTQLTDVFAMMGI